MIYITDAARTLELEKQALATQKITIEQLMDSAGKALAEEVMSVMGTMDFGVGSRRDLTPKEKRPGRELGADLTPKVVVVCGKGNNAGDGFVAARYLNKKGLEVKVLTLYEASQLSKDAKNAYGKLPRDLVIDWEKGAPFIDKAQIVIDAIFGFSFHPPLKPFEKNVIADINKRASFVVSVDVPSGLEATGGQVGEDAIEADMTVSFSCIKKGLLNNVGPNYAGLIKVAHIGISPDLCQRFTQYQALDIYEAHKLLPAKKPLDHKKSKGKVLVVAGSSAFTGAAVLTAEAVLRAGSGFVTLVVPEPIKSLVQEKITPEIIVKGLDSTSDGTLAFAAKREIVDLSQDFDCVSIGPGLTTQNKTSQLIVALLKELSIPLVIDADALNAIAIEPEVIEQMKTRAVLTPHSGELSRLTGLPVAEIEKDRFKAAELLSTDNITVLLKGRFSVIASKEKTFVNLTSNAGMATAGTGDVLTGVIAALFAQGLRPVEAAALGAYIHGLAGDIAAQELTQYSLIATDIIECIPYVFRTLIDGG